MWKVTFPFYRRHKPPRVSVFRAEREHSWRRISDRPLRENRGDPEHQQIVNGSFTQVQIPLFVERIFLNPHTKGRLAATELIGPGDVVRQSFDQLATRY